MEQSANLHLLRGADGETMSARVLALLAELGYLGRAAILDAADFGVPQHRKRTTIFAHRGDEAPQEFPPIPTHTQPMSAGAVLAPPFAGPVLAGTVLARVRAAVNMTAAEGTPMKNAPTHRPGTHRADRGRAVPTGDAPTPMRNPPCRQGTRRRR
eukprot:jgi/Tetstr1/462270/TSEL_007288.t1